MVESVKITLLVCLTCITSSVLILSYNEYTNRYELITSQNNCIYIFDKKTTTLNKCENGKCEVLRTNFPTISKNTATTMQAMPVSNNMPNQTSSFNEPQINSMQQIDQSENQNSSTQYVAPQNASFQQEAMQNSQGTSGINQLPNNNEQLPTLQNLQPVTYS